MATITITTANKEDLFKIINKLGIKEGDITVNLEIKDSKENFEYLSKSDKIKYWDFLTQSKNSKEIEVIDLPKEITTEPENLEEISIFNILNNSIFENSSAPLLNLVKLSWDLSKKNLRLVPSVLYSNMINGIIINNLHYKEDDMVKRLISEYYLDSKFSESLEHLINVLKLNWNSLSRCTTLTDVVTLLFK